MKTKEYFSLPPFFLFLISSRKLASYIWSCFEKKKKKEKSTNFYPTESIQITLIIRNSFPKYEIEKVKPRSTIFASSRLTSLHHLRIQNSRSWTVFIRYRFAIFQTFASTSFDQNGIIEFIVFEKPPILIFYFEKSIEKFRKDTKRKGSHVSSSLFQINVLLPTYGKRLMGEEMNTLACAAPPEHEGENLTSLFNRSLRCLDLYNARPEKDAMILVGILIGILFAIPVCLTTFIFWRRGFFFCGSSGPASFSRAFYKRTMNDDEFWSFFFSLSIFFRFHEFRSDRWRRRPTRTNDVYDRRGWRSTFEVIEVIEKKE